jgi:hypothetical protein
MIKISGYSDDNIFLEGDIDDEIGCYDQAKYLGFSDGTLLKGYYGDGGIWNFDVINEGSLFQSKTEGSEEEDTNDIVYINDGVKWCVIGKKIIQEVNKKVREDQCVGFSDGTLVNTFIDKQGVFRQIVIAKGDLYKTKVEGSPFERTDDVIFVGQPMNWCIEGKDLFINNK